jgi:hypothetical protein
MITRESVLLVLFASFSVIAAAGELFLDDPIDFTNWWMLWNALFQTGLVAVIRLLARDFYLKLISSTLLILSLGEVYDEVLGDPNVLQWNEIGTLILATIYVLYKCRRKQN